MTKITAPSIDELTEARNELIALGLIRARLIQPAPRPEDEVWEYTLLNPATGEAL